MARAVKPLAVENPHHKASRCQNVSSDYLTATRKNKAFRRRYR